MPLRESVAEWLMQTNAGDGRGEKWRKVVRVVEKRLAAAAIDDRERATALGSGPGGEWPRRRGEWVPSRNGAL